MMKKIKIMMGPPMMNGENEEEKEERKPTHLCVEKIKNGFLVKVPGEMDGEGTEFIKNLATAPTIISRLMGIKGKNGNEIDKMVKVKD